MQDLVDLLTHSLLLLAVSEGGHDVIHGGELVEAFPLGPQADLIPVVLDLGLMPQSHSNL